MLLFSSFINLMIFYVNFYIFQKKNRKGGATLEPTSSGSTDEISSKVKVKTIRNKKKIKSPKKCVYIYFM